MRTLEGIDIESRFVIDTVLLHVPHVCEGTPQSAGITETGTRRTNRFRGGRPKGLYTRYTEHSARGVSSDLQTLTTIIPSSLLAPASRRRTWRFGSARASLPAVAHPAGPPAEEGRKGQHERERRNERSCLQRRERRRSWESSAWRVLGWLRRSVGRVGGKGVRCRSTEQARTQRIRLWSCAVAGPGNVTLASGGCRRGEGLTLAHVSEAETFKEKRTLHKGEIERMS
jgi:hypothetical protein